MEVDASIETFGYKMAAMSSKIRPTTVKKLFMAYLQLILTP